VLPEIECTTSSPEEKADAEQILRTIASLPEAYRETLLLRLVEGLSGAEIASLTGLTTDSVRVNLHRGMEKLRDALHMNRPASMENRNV
jgi:RNA polymerase sigma-70 factor (ECF subfamily)